MLRLAVLRTQRGWSQAELARRAGLNNSTLSHIESGRFVPYPGQLAKIARAFGITDANSAPLMEAADEQDL
jgi:transcriptional regulator with XRE-family HTH domain